MSTGTLVIIKADNCAACRRLTANLDEITAAVKRNFPNVDFHIIPLKNMDLRESWPGNEPVGLTKYVRFYPTIYFFPGTSWSEYKKSGKKDFPEGVSSMNADLDLVNHVAKQSTTQYSPSESTQFLKWLSTVANNTPRAPEIKPPVVETRPVSTEKPKSNPFTVSKTNYVATGPPKVGKVCTMQVIGRNQSPKK